MPASRAKRRRQHPLEQLAALAAQAVRSQAEDAALAPHEVAVCWRVALLLSPGLSAAARQWARQQLPAPSRELAEEGSLPPEIAPVAAAVLADSATPTDPLALFYEQFLQAFDGQRRTQRGVFYTPLPLVHSLIANVEQSLRMELGFRESWLDDNPQLRILDPAMGAGLFLTEIVRAARRQVPDDETWNKRAPLLLGRLGGIEILPAAAAIAMIRLAATLQATGYDFASEADIHLHIGDALATPLRPPWTVIIGNPPFSGISEHKHAWVEALLHGRGPAGTARASYFDFAGAPLNERKHWLHDDYVKFLRVAQEQIETAGQGIVALVTSHGYLDNITFRGLREKLLQTFPRISVIDLHGNAKRRERSPEGGRDENVFGIETGIAIGLFRKPPGAVAPRLERADLWGPRAAKEQALAGCRIGELTTLTLPAEYGHSFQEHSADTHPEYRFGWGINAAMPLHTTAPVTARDAFVVADDLQALAERCRDFCDQSLSDDVIRERYFQRTRSRKHAAGDTRGWKLREARRTMQTTEWRALVQPVQYRPLDERVMLWADWLIDWPRSDMMRHLLVTGNQAIITRRQAPPGQPWSYAWLTDKLALDGVIRSDNRGSESLFPLWIVEPTGRQANFASPFVQAIAAATGLQYDEQGEARDGYFNAAQLFHYSYALLHSARYRARYQTALASDFPRILLPRSAKLLHRLAAIGARLASVHTASSLPFCGAVPTHVAAGYPRHANHCLYLNATDYFAGVSTRTWELEIGTYQVCMKLLKHWRNRPIDAPQVGRLGAILRAARRTVVLQRAVDRWALRGVEFEGDFVQDVGSGNPRPSGEGGDEVAG